MPSCRRRDILRPEGGEYHAFARCVRRAHLLGVDPLTGVDHSHRRIWIERRLEILVAAFTIDVAWFAVMANHLHLILRAMPRIAQKLGAEELARRWLRVFPGRRVLSDEPVEPSEEQVKRLAADKRMLRKIRKRLGSVSWFMRALCEPIARRANLEDKVKGRFWQGRYGLRELTDESALLACGMYVDLNQIRAGEAKLPHDSAHCSVFRRIIESQDAGARSQSWLAPLTLQPSQIGEPQLSLTGRRASDKGLLPLSLEQYVRLLTWAGTHPNNGKAAIPREVAEIVERIGLDPDGVRSLLDVFPGPFHRVVGPLVDLKSRAAEQPGRHWFQGVGWADLVFRRRPPPNSEPDDSNRTTRTVS